MTNEVSGQFSPTGPLTVVTRAIAVTPDTIRAVLHERCGNADGAIFSACLAISITIWATYFTASFHSSLGLSASTIESFFLLSAIITAMVSIFYGVKFFLGRKKYSIDSIVEEIEDRAGRS